MAVVVVLLAATFPVRGATAQDSEGSGDPETVVLFIIDLSGSMNEDFGNGKTKLEMAKEVFAKAFAQYPDEMVIGLRVYGDQLASKGPEARQENCEKDTRVVVPADSGTTDEILQAVEGFEATGDTPIGLALEKTAKEDIPEGALANVLLFSDGRDECFDADLNGDPEVGPSWGPDPCKVAKELMGSGVDVRIEKVDTVGFQAGEGEEELRCIAEATGGQFTPIETEEDAEDLLPEVLARTGTARPAEHLCPDNVIEGGSSAEDAPDLERIEPGETSRCYTDTIEMNEERWYRIEDYGPGPGDTTVTFFALPLVEGTTLELRTEPGPEGEVSGSGAYGGENEVLTEPQDSVRSGGYQILSEESHTLYWVAALRSDDPRADGTFELELLLQGEAWGGSASGCVEGMTCWYETKIDGAEARLDELRLQLEGDEGTQALQSEVDDLEAELASLTAKRQALENGTGGGTNWLLPALLFLLTLGAGGVWFFQGRRGQLQPTAAGTPGAASSGVIGTIDLGPSGTATVSRPGAGDAGLPGEPLGEPTDLSAPGGREDVTEVPATASPPPGAEGPSGGREVPDSRGGSKDLADASGLEVPSTPSGPDPSEPARESKPAGWYGDPDAPDLLRWWDGSTWTDHTQRKA